MATFTTLNQIRSKSPCTEGWTKLLKSLKKTEADDEPLALTYILESNGIDDTIWCLRSLSEEHKTKIQWFTLRCAQSMKHLMKDERSLKALQVTEDYLNGKASLEEVKAAHAAAYAAADAAAYATNAADAAYATNAADAAADAAYATNAAYAAADAAADAAYATNAADAAADAAYATNAAYAAANADAAAYAAYAADAAANAANAAANATNAAANAADVAEKAKQKQIFIEIFG